MSNKLERGIVIVGSGGVGVTMLTDKKDGVVVVEKQPTPYKAPIPPQIECVLPYFDGKSARNKRREAERNAKKKRK